MGMLETMEQPGESAQATMVQDPSETRSMHIVMVDDDVSEHLLMEMAAAESGLQAEFTFYEDGAELLLHLAGVDSHALPDLIVLDIRMAGLDGHRTLDELQADPVLWQIPVIVFTSSSRPVDRQESFDRGALDFEMKPSEFEAMVAFAGDLRSRALGLRTAIAQGTAEKSIDRERRRDVMRAIGAEVDASLQAFLSQS